MAMEPFGSTAEPGSETQCPFDLEKENINGMFSNLTLLSMLLMSLTKGRKCYVPKKTFKKEYDYIVVGGGTAGSVMASRLSENACVSVLLLEAGGEAPLISEVPAYAIYLRGTSIDWNDTTTPQEHSAYSQMDNKVVINGGKVLGGTSVLNAMLYVRGNKKNYDDWEAEGATGWSYKDVLPYFKKLEDNRITGLDREYHATGGPMTVELPNYDPEIKGPILQATTDLGYQMLDVNGRHQTGMYDIQATVRHQQRCSTAKAYLEPARNRSNLDILINAFVTKILIKGRKRMDKRAYGVEFKFDGCIHRVYVRREVILSNGAIRTPQLLMLSGIGPRKHLKKMHIRVKVDLPAVGQNMMDHPTSYLFYTVNDTITPVTRKIFDPANIEMYIENRKGPLAAPHQVTVLGFFDGFNTTANSIDFPKQELFFLEYDIPYTKPTGEEEEQDGEDSSYEGRPLYICYSSLLQPYSRGEIKLYSKDPYRMPSINPNYYADKRDVETVVEGLELSNRIANQSAMQQVQAKLAEIKNPACEQFEGKEYYSCYVTQTVATLWHYSGTARMGNRTDSRSVVDPQLRVIGVKRLRVVSAAVFPIVTSGNTNIPTMMVAEKAYAMMKNDTDFPSCDTA